MVLDIQQDNPGVLYVVATPIGNLEDISPRAVNVLKGVAIIAAEDTRRTRSLLAALGLPVGELIALHDHNERTVSGRLLGRLRSGADVALVSDAGTPLISDPGFTLIGACYAAGVPVRPVPGPSALACALSVCPLPAQDFRFVGFLPAKAGSRRARLRTLLESGTLVFFEAPHRMAVTLRELGELAPGRQVFVGREMTKKFESYLCGDPLELAAELEQQGALRGEFVCVVAGEPAAGGAAGAPDVQTVMSVLGRELPPAQAARIGAELTGAKRQDLYELLMSAQRD